MEIAGIRKSNKPIEVVAVRRRNVFVISCDFSFSFFAVTSSSRSKTLPEISNQKFVCNSILDNSPIKSEEMGIIIDIEITIGEEASLISLFMTASCLESLKGTTFFQLTIKFVEF